jgi:hypothetical protein
MFLSRIKVRILDILLLSSGFPDSTIGKGWRALHPVSFFLIGNIFTQNH